MAPTFVSCITKRGKKRGNAMLAAAADIFIEYGFEGTTLDMVIERSGGSRSTLYKTFGGKNGLFLAVIKDILVAIFEDVEETPIEQNVKSVLTHYGSQFMMRILEPQSINLYRLIISETTRFPAIGQQFYEYGPKRTYQILTEKLTSLPELKHHHPEFLFEVASCFLEMIKAEIFMQVLCIPDFQIKPDLINKRLTTSVALTYTLLLEET